MKSKLFIMFFCLQCFYSFAQNKITSKINMQVDSLVNAEMKSKRIPGLSLVVVRDGKIDYIKGYGFANLEHRVPVKPETIFQSGSVGKQFTAFAILLLVEDGKLSLEDRLTKFFPEATSWDSITVRNLLTHTSGFNRSYDVNLRSDFTEDSLYQFFKKVPLKFAVGEKSEYSNMGYATLGIIISKVTGKFYGEFLKERIFEPLGMTTARVISESDIIPNRAAGYELVNGELKNQEWVSPSLNTLADGSLYLTALDMAKWEAGLNAQKLLKEESYEMMWSPVKLNDGSTHPYGFGWRIDSLQGQKIVAHDGNWQGFSTVIKRYPLRKFSVIVLANLRRANVNKIATRIMESYQPELSIASLKTIRDKEPGITKLVNEFINNVAEKKLRTEQFTTELAVEIMDSTMQAKGSEHFKAKGKFLKSELLSRKELGDDTREYRYRLLFSKEIAGFMIQFNKENKIVDLQLIEY